MCGGLGGQFLEHVASEVLVGVEATGLKLFKQEVSSS